MIPFVAWTHNMATYDFQTLCIQTALIDMLHKSHIYLSDVVLDLWGGPIVLHSPLVFGYHL